MAFHSDPTPQDILLAELHVFQNFLSAASFEARGLLKRFQELHEQSSAVIDEILNQEPP